MNSVHSQSGPKLVHFPKGKIVGARWLIKRILGMGAYGAVYEVQSVKNPLINGALKAESNFAAESILKIEVEVLKQLQNRKYTVRLLHSGKRETYSYLVMTLCGPDLIALKHTKNLETFSESTILRIAILSLYAIKQLHEIGYVHRDIKPSNIAISTSVRHFIYLLDYGMVFLRGTLRYCSVNTHKRFEQGRVDDLWSLMYMLVDLRTNHLPWGKSTREDRILYQKESTSDRKLLADGQLEYYEEILKHLRSLSYPDRPDYLQMYKMMVSPMMRKQYMFDEPYDWEIMTERMTQEETSVSVNCITRKSIFEGHSHSLIPHDIPMAQKEAFTEGENDVPDIKKTKYHICTRQSPRERRVGLLDESNTPVDDLP